MDNLNRPITRSEINSVIRKKQKTTPYKQTRWFHQGILQNIQRRTYTEILLKLFQGIEEEGMLPKSFYEVTITLIPNPDKDNAKKENYTPISLMNTDAKIVNKVLAN